MRIDKLVAVLVGVLLVLAVACGGDEGGSSTTPDSAGTPDMTMADTTTDTTGSPDVAEDPGSAPDLTCQILSPAGGAVVGAEVEVQVQIGAGAEHVALLVNGTRAVEADVDPAAEGTTTLTWQPTDEGEMQLVAKVSCAAGSQAQSGVVVVTVDRTAPVVGLPQGRFLVVQGTIALPVAVDEANLASLRLLDEDGNELAKAFPGTTDLLLDGTGMGDGLTPAVIEAVDAAGNQASADVRLVIANDGEALDVQYVPLAKVSVPENYQTVEYHTRVVAIAQPGVRRVITWMTWDPSGDWLMEYSLGQGTCPHNGIQYMAAESREGEIVLDLARRDLPEGIVAKLPAADQESNTFPYNQNAATFGAWFGHAAPLDPADHLNESVDIEVGYVVLY